MWPTARKSEHKKRAISATLIYSPRSTLGTLNTYAAFKDTKTNDSSEHIVVIPKYGPLDSLGPSQNP